MTISVEDTGTGIKPEDLNRIFNAFEQSESGVRFGGTGLGLAISRNFARLMGGDLTVESTVGRGSTFTFSFEVRTSSVFDGRERVGITPIPVGLEANRVRLKALIVDDVTTNRELMNELLSSIGFDTRIAANGEDALEAPDEWRPDVILMDLLMPGMGGIEATRRLRAYGSKAVIVAITASATAETEQEARAAGADGFLRKPYQEGELLVTIGELLGVRYVYEPDVEPAPLNAYGSAAEDQSLSLLKTRLPADLIKELREAAIQARAGRLVSLAEQACEYSEDAATQIKVLAEDFRYDTLLAALE
jgi:CheY-like chemotaxis protein